MPQLIVGFIILVLVAKYWNLIIVFGAIALIIWLAIRYFGAVNSKFL